MYTLSIVAPINMDKFIQLLNSADEDVIQQEIEGKKIKNSPTFNQAIKAAYPEVKNLSTKAMLLQIWKKVIAGAAMPREGTISRIFIKLYKALDRVIKILYENENTMESVCTEFRKPVRSKYGDKSEVYKQSVYNMGVSQERSQQRKEEYSAKVKARNASRAELQPIYVEDIINVIQKLKVSNDPYEKSLALLLATGSRSIELFKVSKYYETNDPNIITVKGIAKDKGQRGYDKVVIQRPLVGLTGDEVIEYVHEVREDLDLKGTNAQISAKTNTPLNKAFTEWVGSLVDDKKMTSHKTRYIYGNCAYLLYGKPKKIPYESFIQEILGHASGESTKSYLGINVQMKTAVVNKAPDDIKSLFENELKNMKQKISSCCVEPVDKVDLTEYKNSHRVGMPEEDKISNVVGALLALKRTGVKMQQRELRSVLGYSSAIMTAGYKQAREEHVI